MNFYFRLNNNAYYGVMLKNGNYNIFFGYTYIYFFSINVHS